MPDASVPESEPTRWEDEFLSAWNLIAAHRRGEMIDTLDLHMSEAVVGLRIQRDQAESSLASGLRVADTERREQAAEIERLRAELRDAKVAVLDEARRRLGVSMFPAIEGDATTSASLHSNLITGIDMDIITELRREVSGE